MTAETDLFIVAELAKVIAPDMLGGCAAEKEAETKGDVVVEHRWGRYTRPLRIGTRCWVTHAPGATLSSGHTLAETWMVIFTDGRVLRLNTPAARWFLRSLRDADGKVITEVGGVAQQLLNRYKWEMNR